MLRPIKYLVIVAASMATITALSAVQAKTQIKANLISDSSQSSQATPVAANNPAPATPVAQAAAPAPTSSAPAAPAASSNVPSKPAPTPAAAPVNNSASTSQTANQKSTQPLTARSQSGQTINMSSATNFSASSMQNVNAAAKTDATSCSTGSFELQFQCLINNYRASLGLHSLAIDGGLNSVASNYAAYMYKTAIFSHTADGRTFLDRCAAAGTTCWAENLALGFSSPQTLFEMWKASPGHNANMVNPGYRSMGLGISGSYAALYLR